MGLGIYVFLFLILTNVYALGWKDGSVVKSICCRATTFEFQHTCDGSQPPFTAMPGDPVPSSWAPSTYMVHIYTCRQITHIT